MASIGEMLVFLLSMLVTGYFVITWYAPLIRTWPSARAWSARWVLAILPVAALGIILYTLMMLASFDVEGFYIIYYIVLGFAALFYGEKTVRLCLDLSLRDDILGNENMAALPAFSGAFLGLTLIYAGANIGDGPGWWCVVIAGGVGWLGWLAFAMIANLFTHATERITVGRDLSCGIRFGFYLAASGLIFARASGGDWTSFNDTMMEFSAAWPILPLTVLYVLVELLFVYGGGKSTGRTPVKLWSSLLWGLLLLLFALLLVFKVVPPPTENPLYGDPSYWRAHH